MRKYLLLLIISLLCYSMFYFYPAYAAYRFANFKARSPIHIWGKTSALPQGLSPDQIKQIYNLPKAGGKGTIALIGAYDAPSIEKDLAVFDKAFGLVDCTAANGCFEKHKMSAKVRSDPGWAMETSLDVEWAHAIAPQAHILLVEADTQSGPNLLKAVDYARQRKDVVSVSMSWGGPEFSDETSLDSHFVSPDPAHPIAFFASSGDQGAGASWPAASPNVIAVGGTSLALSSSGNLLSETAWAGSGGGISQFEKAGTYQDSFNISKSGGMRAIPDVSYDADPHSGYPIYRGKWYVVGGTSAGAPQWAAIASMGPIRDSILYADKASDNPQNYFRDITSGSNGACGYFCTARKHYDYVTGLGSPVTSSF